MFYIPEDIYLSCSTINNLEKDKILKVLEKLEKKQITLLRPLKINFLYSYKASKNYRLIIQQMEDKNYIVIDIIYKRKIANIKYSYFKEKIEQLKYIKNTLKSDNNKIDKTLNEPEKLENNDLNNNDVTNTLDNEKDDSIESTTQKTLKKTHSIKTTTRSYSKTKYSTGKIAARIKEHNKEDLFSTPGYSRVASAKPPLKEIINEREDLFNTIRFYSNKTDKTECKSIVRKIQDAAIKSKKTTERGRTKNSTPSKKRAAAKSQDSINRANGNTKQNSKKSKSKNTKKV